MSKVITVSVPWTGKVTYTDGSTGPELEGIIDAKLFSPTEFDIHTEVSTLLM